MSDRYICLCESIIKFCSYVQYIVTMTIHKGTLSQNIFFSIVSSRESCLYRKGNWSRNPREWEPFDSARQSYVCSHERV